MTALIYSPCLFAAGSLYIALNVVKRKDGSKESIWSDKLNEESRLSEQRVIACAKQLQIHLHETPVPTSTRSLNEIIKKYSTAEKHYVADMEFPVL